MREGGSVALRIGIDPRQLDASKISSAIKPVFDRWTIAKAWLYGSVARGEQTEYSDVDIAFVLLPSARIGWNILHLQRELEDALDTEVDIQTAPNRHMASKRFLREFDRDKVVVYERSAE